MTKTCSPLILLVGMALASPQMWATPNVEAFAADPATLAPGRAKGVLFSARISDPTVLTNSIIVQRVDATGRRSLVGRLNDRGEDGDAVAGDRVYSLRVNVLETVVGPVQFVVNAAFRGVVGRVISSSIPLTVTNDAAPRQSSVVIESPANLTFLNTSPATVNGTVSPASDTVRVNGILAPVTNGRFSVAVPLVEGTNTLTAVTGLGSTATLQYTLDTTPPRVAIDSPANGFSTTADRINVSGNVNDIVLGTVNDQEARVTVSGRAAVVANRTFLATDIPLVIGDNTIQAVARDRVGNSITTQILVRRLPSNQATIRVLSGNNQAAPIGSALPAPLVAQVVNAAGAPVPNVEVLFTVTKNNARLAAAAGGTPGLSLTARTNSAGQATAFVTLGSRSGAGGNEIQATATGFSSAAIFTLTGTPSQASRIVVDTGNTQIGAVSERLPLPFVVVVTDEGFNRLAGVPVSFRVRQGGGGFLQGAEVDTVTDSDGRALANFVLGPNPGNDNNRVEATFPNNPGLPAAFLASGRIPGDPAQTRISGVVLDNSTNPIPGVTMRLFQINQGQTGNIPTEVAASVQTNAQGQFVIQPAPVGAFKLMADGSTAPGPGSYPTLEYDIVTVSGQDNTVGMPVYLPVLDVVNRLCVNESTGGTLVLPSSPGFSLTVAPGSARFPGGARTGCITVTPVNGDRVPMAPGFGQQPRFVVTIQPVGTTFNPPAAISIPNVDGLRPGEITEMYSFDHDLASFVAIGTGTVTNDGSIIRSNPGVGVLKAGWHCGGNPQTAGTAGTCPTCQRCEGTGCAPSPAATACDDSKFCTDNDRCRGGACSGENKPDTQKVVTASTLGGVGEIFNDIQDFLNFVGRGTTFRLPNLSIVAETETYTSCCNATESFTPIRADRKAASVDWRTGAPVPLQFPPWSRNWTIPSFVPIVGGQDVGYGIEASWAVNTRVAVEKQTHECQGVDPCWRGSAQGSVNGTFGIFAEIPGVGNDCGPNGNEQCSLFRLAGNFGTGFSIGGTVGCSEITFAPVQWSGLTATATVQVFEGTWFDYSRSVSIELFQPRNIIPEKRIPL